MKKLIVTPNEVSMVNLTEQEIIQREEERLLQEFEQSLKPSQQKLAHAEFELKTIEILITLGVI